MKRGQVGVIGSAGQEEYPYVKPNKDMFNAAEKLGTALAKQDCIIVNGGKGGIMEAVSMGAKKAGGITVAEISGLGRRESNGWVDVEVVTGDVAFRGPSQLVAMSDVIVALGGGAGTLQEICVAYRMQKPVVLLTGYGGWSDKLSDVEYLDERQLIKFRSTDSIQDAIKIALSLIE